MISVIIPVYNGDNYLREAIESVFSQTYPNYEVIVVDDGSTDLTWKIIESYDGKIKGYHKENGGVASALNWGINHAKGEWIAWLSHDDLFLPEKLEQQINFLALHPEFIGCYTDFAIVDANGVFRSTVRTPWFPPRQLPRQFLRNMYINGSTTLIQKACFEQIGGFDERLSHTQDFEMWLRVAEHFEFGRISQVLLKSRFHPNQGALNFETQLHQEQALFRDLFQRYGATHFFLELEPLHDSALIEARGRRRFGDELAFYRGWYRFALEQYRLSSEVRPEIQTWFKAGLTRSYLAAWGDEEESLLLGKRSRILLSMGQRSSARSLSARLWLRHPLRLDALVTFLGTWIPPQLMTVLKRLRRRH